MVKCPVCTKPTVEVVLRDPDDWRNERLRCTSCGTRMTGAALLENKQRELEQRTKRVGGQG